MWLAFPTSDYYDGSDALPPLQPQLVQTGRAGRAIEPPMFTMLLFAPELRPLLYSRPLLPVASYLAAGFYPVSHCRFSWWIFFGTLRNAKYPDTQAITIVSQLVHNCGSFKQSFLS
jgi:hypothetical protein